MRTKDLLISGMLLATAAYTLDLTSFEDDAWKKRISDGTHTLEIVQEHATHGRHAAKVFFKGSEKDSWPGIAVKFSPEDLVENNALVFTAWQESGARLTMSTRTDYEDKKVFGAIKLNPSSTGTNEILLFNEKPGSERRLVKQIYLYLKCPRKDETIWFDNFRLIKSRNTAAPIAYIPPEGERTPTADETKLGAQLFTRTWMEHIFRNVKPLPGESPAPVLKAAACPGESEPVQLGVRALADIAGCTLSITAPFKNDKGAVIPPEAFTVYTLAYLDKRITYQSNRFYKQIPMVLEKRDAVAINANESQSFWIDVAVPPTAKPGLYKGSLQVTLDGRTAQVPYELRVRPFVAPEAADMLFGEYLTGPVDANTFQEKVAQYRHDMAFMRKLNLTSVGLCIAPDTKLFTYQDGRVQVKFADEDIFVAFMGLYLEYKYPCPIILLADPGAKFATNQGFKEFTPEFKACYQAFWKAMQAECNSRGWPEMIVQPVDEPGWKGLDDQERNVTLLKYLKEIPGMRTEHDGPDDNYFYNGAGPYSDLWNFNGCFPEPDKMKELKAQGKLVALYNNDVESYRPVTSRYVAGFFMARSGGHGVYNWAMRGYHASPFDDFDTPHGDTTNYYPGDKNHAGGPGIGMLSFREGIDDYRYIRYLQTLIRQNPGPEATYAQKVLDSILESIQYFRRPRSAAEFTPLPPSTKGDLQVTGVLNLKTGWRLEDYDHAREIIANQIEILLGAKESKKKSTPPVLKVAATAAPASLEDAAPANRTVYKVMVPRSKSIPVLDGTLNDDCWKNAGVMQDFSINIGGKPLAQTRAMVTTDGLTLFLGVECEEEYMNHLTADITQKNGPVFNDDCIEIFIDPTMKMAGYYQLAVNPLGTIFCGGNLGAWNPGVKVVTGRGSDRWTVELAIPLKDLRLRGNAFGFNICRERRPLEIFELTCWSPTGSSFGTPARFGTASLGSSWIRGVDAGDVGVGKSAIQVSVMNPKGSQEELTVETSWKLTGADGASAEGAATQKAVPGTLSTTLSFPLKLSQAGGLDILVQVKDAKGELLEKQAIHREVKAPVIILTASPFMADNWSAFLKLDYRQDASENLELQAWAGSAPKNVARLKVGDSQFFTTTLQKGGFAPLDTLHARLVDLKSKRTIGTTETILFAK